MCTRTDAINQQQRYYKTAEKQLLLAGWCDIGSRTEIGCPVRLGDWVPIGNHPAKAFHDQAFSLGVAGGYANDAVGIFERAEVVLGIGAHGVPYL